MSTWLDEIKNTVAELEVQATKFTEKGNNSAGTRTRKLLQNLKALAQKGREEIQAKKLADKAAEKAAEA